MAESNAANPRGYDNPDAAEFTRRHSLFYDRLQGKDEHAARLAYRSLRSWAWARCIKDQAFAKWYDENVSMREDVVKLGVLDEAATRMKAVWHEQGLWEWGKDEWEELVVPNGHREQTA